MRGSCISKDRLICFCNCIRQLVGRGKGWGLEFSGCVVLFPCYPSTVADFDNEFQLPEDLVALMGFRKVPLDECFADVSLDDFTE